MRSVGVSWEPPTGLRLESPKHPKEKGMATDPNVSQESDPKVLPPRGGEALLGKGSRKASQLALLTKNMHLLTRRRLWVRAHKKITVRPEQQEKVLPRKHRERFPTRGLQVRKRVQRFTRQPREGEEGRYTEHRRKRKSTSVPAAEIAA